MSALKEHGEICDSLKELYRKKNADYGDSFAKARKEVPFYTLGKLYDKFSRISNLMLNPENREVSDETVEDTLLDLANYAIMEVAERRSERGDTIESS